MNDGVGRRDGFTTFLVVACGALAVLVVLLALQNRRLKTEIADAEARAATPAGSLAAGDRLVALDLLQGGGEPVTVPFDGGAGRTLLLVYSASCPACRETMPYWNDLARGPAASSRIVGVRTDTASAAADDLVPAFPVYAFDPARPGLSGKFPFVPATVVIDASGTVVDVVFGVPDAGRREAIATALAG